VPEGHAVLQDQYGNRLLINVEAAKAERDRLPLSTLTEEQVSRIEAFKAILAEHDKTSIEQTLANFRRDFHPEREIQLWERMARTYSWELADRPGADADERRLLYKTIFACSFYGSNKEAVLGMVPAAASLPHLDRVFERWSE